MRPAPRRWVVSPAARERLRAAAERVAVDRAGVSHPALAAAVSACLGIGLGLSALATAPADRSEEAYCVVYVGRNPPELPVPAPLPAPLPPPAGPEPEAPPVEPDPPADLPVAAAAQAPDNCRPDPPAAEVAVAAVQPQVSSPLAPVEQEAPPSAVRETRGLAERVPPAASAADGADAARSNYWESVRCAVAGQLRYPPAARRRGIEGLVVLRVGVDGGGRLRNAGVTEAGDQRLAAAAVAAARRAAPFPPPGAVAPGGGEAPVPIRFRLE